MRAGNNGMSQASKAMQQKQRFKQTLSDLRMAFQKFVRRWPDSKVAGNGKDMRITLATPIQTRTGTLTILLTELVGYLYGILHRDVKPFATRTFCASVCRQSLVNRALEMPML